MRRTSHRINSFVWILLLTILLTAGSSTPGHAESVDVFRVDVSGPIDAGTRHSVLSRLKTVRNGGFDLVVLRIHSSGGRIDFALDVSNAIDRLSVPVVAFVRGHAGTVAALLCISSDRVYMQEGAVLGTGPPTLQSGGRSIGRPQMIDRLRETYVQRAKEGGYAESLVAALVDPAVEVRWVETEDGTRTLMSGDQYRALKGRERTSLDVVSESGRLLRIKAGDAFRFGFCRKVVKRLVQVVETELHRAGRVQYHLSAVPRAWYESLLSGIATPTITGLLIIIGLVTALIELNSPGVESFGSIALVSFGTVMYTYAALDVAGGIALTIFLVGGMLYTLDVSLMPDPVSTGILGLFVILFALILAGQGFVLPELRTAPWELEYALDEFGTVLLSAGIGVLTYLITLQVLPDHVFDVPVVCCSPDPGDIRGAPEQAPPLRAGAQGKVEKALRPIGVLRFDDDRVIAFAEGAFLNRGVRVEVVEVGENGRAVLRPL